MHATIRYRNPAALILYYFTGGTKSTPETKYSGFYFASYRITIPYEYIIAMAVL